MLPILLSLALLGSGALVAENPYDVEGGLTPGVIAGFAKKAGFPDEVIPEAVRIVLLESKGQPDKLQNDRGPAVGLFQVDLSAHWDLGARLLQGKNLRTDQTAAETTYSSNAFDYSSSG